MHRLIVVEDEDSIRLGLINNIPWNEYGFEVAGEAANGLEALELIRKVQTDVILTDIRMPVMDGLELAETLRRNGDHAKIVILSVYNDFEYVRKALYLGASDYLLKPTREREIRGTFLKLKEQLDNISDSIQKDKQKENVNFFRDIHGGDNGHTFNQRDFIPTRLDFDGMKELEIGRELIECVINLKVESITPLTYRYMDCLANTYCDAQMIYIKVDEFIAQLTLKLYEKRIDFKNFCDDITLYHKISDNKTFGDLRKWFKEFLHKVCGLIKNLEIFRMDPVIRRVTDYIHANLSEKLGLNELADMAFMNATYFSRYFKQKTGKTVTDYITDIRIEEGKKLLLEAEMKIYEIAEKIGYDDWRHFCKVFKVKEGLSPSEFRRNVELEVRK